jgi:predicted ATPase
MSETNWYVITGAPSSGKTTLVNELEKLGYWVIHETARALIEEEMEKDRTHQEIRSDKSHFENLVLDRKIAIEAQLPKDKVIFLDRAIPDSVAYFEMAGLDSRIVFAKSPRNRYKKVFLLDPLPYMRDRARIEDQEEAERLDRALETAYRMFDYEVTRIRVMPVQERLRTILEGIGNYKGSECGVD